MGFHPPPPQKSPELIPPLLQPELDGLLSFIITEAITATPVMMWPPSHSICRRACNGTSRCQLRANSRQLQISAPTAQANANRMPNMPIYDHVGRYRRGARRKSSELPVD